jgi:hypothetical protein
VLFTLSAAYHTFLAREITLVEYGDQLDIGDD